MALGILLACRTATGANTDNPEPSEPQVLRFEWRPQDAPNGPYKLTDPLDQHQIAIYPGVGKAPRPAVIVGFHGQPKRGRPPREYAFFSEVKEVVAEMIARKEIPPVVLVLPAFVFQGQNWPEFDVREFQQKVETILADHHIQPALWAAFGHSGAAGCGGDGGLNQAHRFRGIRAVGFFDTCLGKGWQRETQRLRRAKIPTVNIHSVETAAFSPRQRPEYQSTFDFGRAYGPLGLKPITCPAIHPGKQLRDQTYRCAATQDGIINGFVVDTGEGEAAHKAVVRVALRYFLAQFLFRAPAP